MCGKNSMKYMALRSLNHRCNAIYLFVLWFVFRAAAHNHVNVITFLIKSGVDVNHADSISGATPLIAAVLNGSFDAVVALHDMGCDIHR